MQVQIIESNRGGKIALHDGHSYNHKQSTVNCIHWRCTKYYKLKCPAILKTKNQTVIETKGTHNHKCDPGECKAKKVANQIKRAQSVVEKMDELAIYFKSTYIENPIVIKKPPFPIEMWNKYDAAGEGVARTTSSVNGWHCGLQEYFSGSSPNIWLLLRYLEKDSKMQKFNYVQETAGLLCSKCPRYEKNRCKTSEVLMSSKMLCHFSEQ